MRNPFFKPIAASAFVLALYLAFFLWSVLQGAAKLPEDARPAPGARSNFEVELDLFWNRSMLYCSDFPRLLYELVREFYICCHGSASFE